MAGRVVLAINFGLTALRFLWVWISLYVSYRIAARKGDTERSPPGFRLVAAMSVAGVRGAITLAGVLTLPLTLMDGSEFPARDLAIFLAAGVIILSLTAASFLLPFLLRGLQSSTEAIHDNEIEFARPEAAKAAIRAERETIFALARKSKIPDDKSRALVREIDLLEERLAKAGARH